MLATLPPSARPLPANQRLLTCADVAQMPESLPTGDVRYELDNGRLVVLPPPGDVHSAIQAKVGGEFYLQGERPGHGKARVESGIVLWRNPDRLVGADAAFIAAAALPLRVTREGYLETIPDLVVEIRSRNDTMAELAAKAEDYLTAGVRIVWLVDPQSRTVVVRRGRAPAETLDDAGVLDGGDVIPGFRLPLAALFGE